MVHAIYFENVSVNDYAARMGVTQSAISHRLQTVKKKLKKLLADPHIRPFSWPYVGRNKKSSLPERMNVMRHKLKISVSKEPQTGGWSDAAA